VLNDPTKSAESPAGGHVIESVTRSLAVREIHHRIANALALLVASMRLELKSAGGQELQEALLRHERHIMAISELHQFFATDNGNSEVSTLSYFERLCDLLARAILEPMRIGCEASICDRALPVIRCEQLGLIVTELATNAAKHAFRGAGGGRVRIDLSSQGTSWSCIVSDNGVGMQRRERGTGSQIVDGLIEGLGGYLHVQTGSEGTAISLTFNA